MAEPDPPALDDQDPADAPDSPDDETGDSADDAEAESPNENKRLADTQRKLHEVTQELAEYRRAQADLPAAASGDESDAVAEQNFALALEIAGAQAREAWESPGFLDVYTGIQTPADELASYEAYYEARLRATYDVDGEQQPEAPQGRTRDERVQPRVDDNRSDQSPDSVDQQITEAGKRRDLPGAIEGMMKKAGWFG